MTITQSNNLEQAGAILEVKYMYPVFAMYFNLRMQGTDGKEYVFIASHGVLTLVEADGFVGPTKQTLIFEVAEEADAGLFEPFDKWTPKQCVDHALAFMKRHGYQINSRTDGCGKSLRFY